ncbi:hypothetical protein ACVU7I_11425 [Patulibacter sp. S7RM1-6]
MSPLRKVLVYFGIGRSTGEPPVDARSPLQVVIGAIVGGVVAGLLMALFGEGAVQSVVFGVLVGVLFLVMDLGLRRRQRDGPRS